MSKSNPLCQAAECDTPFGCAHRGPHGQLCHFETEKRLCEFLDRRWDQHVSLESLLDEVGHRLGGASNKPADELARQLRPFRELYPHLGPEESAQGAINMNPDKGIT